jgi:hypothetical protein
MFLVYGIPTAGISRQTQLAGVLPQPANRQDHVPAFMTNNTELLITKPLWLL